MIFTGTPKKLNQSVKDDIISELRTYSSAPVFFFHTETLPIRPLFDDSVSNIQSWGSFCGIAHPQSFHDSVSKSLNITDSLNFADHHDFAEKDLAQLKSKMVNFGGSVEAWVTTEKDAMRIKDLEDWRSIPIFYLPIVLKINEEEENEWNLWWKKKI